MPTHFHTGRNVPGYLPDGDGGVYAHRTFDEAKTALIADLKFTEDHALSETEAENACHAAEDANLFAESDLRLEWSVTVDDGNLTTAYWIMTCHEDCEPDDVELEDSAT